MLKRFGNQRSTLGRQKTGCCSALCNGWGVVSAFSQLLGVMVFSGAGYCFYEQPALFLSNSCIPGIRHSASAWPCFRFTIASFGRSPGFYSFPSPAAPSSFIYRFLSYESVNSEKTKPLSLKLLPGYLP
ncbi:uncharacterized protein LOC131227855 [Magnolia sinica]|uniref:uncharacterized protein LOC131227855 n=1 Tax=Magnolia sinica TaxID=86752 RepID=UPI002658B53C|nr:uncharacterized protein LOC131227855 [Magnolia sinica]